MKQFLCQSISAFFFQDSSDVTDHEMKRISTVAGLMEMLDALRGFAPTHQAEAEETGAEEE